jgi:hypothetical protein
MTLKNLVIATAAALSFAAVPMASAENTQPALVDLTPLGCEVLADVQFAAWEWTEGTQTQFGGGAVYAVNYTIPTQSEVAAELEVEVDLVRFDPESTMTTKMVYKCPTDEEYMGNEAAPAGSCIAEILDVTGAVEELTEASLSDSLGSEETLTINSSVLVGVFVKAMNPGVAKGPGGRQNYEKTNVCDVPEEVEIVETGL